jgi:hypothetical protein
MCRLTKTRCIALSSVVALLVLTPSLRAQAVGSLIGSLTDQFTLVPLVGASVSVMDHELSAVTNEDGHFAIQGVPSGEVSIRMEHLGHISLVVLVAIGPAEVSFVQAELSPMALLLDELRIVADRRPLNRGGAAVTEFRPTASESAFTTMELLTARIPSLRIQGGESGSGSRNDVRIRGSGSVVGSNQPSLYIDGVRGDLELLAELPSTDVVRVQVLRGPSASALYQDAVNGVILVETVRGRVPAKVRKPGPPPA